MTDIVFSPIAQDFDRVGKEASAGGNYWQSFASMLGLPPCQFAAMCVRHYNSATTRIEPVLEGKCSRPHLT
jgi:hypothetical protein